MQSRKYSNVDGRRFVSLTLILKSGKALASDFFGGL